MKPMHPRINVTGICEAFDGECSSDDGRYSGERNVTNTGKACFPWRSNNKCFKVRD